MWRVLLIGLSACSLALCLATSVAAQGTRNAILETPAARLELIGLKRWTLGMIQDSLARYAPGESLASHACAAILRQKLGFADAAAQYYSPSPGSTKGYWAVPVVEPQDSARVRYRELPRDSLPTVRSGRQLSSLSGSAIRSFSPQSRHLRSCSAGCTQTERGDCASGTARREVAVVLFLGRSDRSCAGATSS